MTSSRGQESEIRVKSRKSQIMIAARTVVPLPRRVVELPTLVLDAPFGHCKVTGNSQGRHTGQNRHTALHGVLPLGILSVM